MKWRLIENGPFSAELNMAIDEALALSVINKGAPPVLRFYSWATPAVTIGYFQKQSDINITYCEQNNIPIVRRPTGGRAILHGNELTYSVSARTDHHSAFRSLRGSYEILSRAFQSAFVNIGLSVHVRHRERQGKGPVHSPRCFDAVSFGEIVSEGRKVIGSAQRRLQGGFLQQGSIPFETDSRVMDGVFGLDNKGVEGGDMKTGMPVRRDTLKKAIISGFHETFQAEFISGDLTPEEKAAAEELVLGKYGSILWQARR